MDTCKCEQLCIIRIGGLEWTVTTVCDAHAPATPGKFTHDVYSYDNEREFNVERLSGPHRTLLGNTNHDHRIIRVAYGERITEDVFLATVWHEVGHLIAVRLTDNYSSNSNSEAFAEAFADVAVTVHLALGRFDNANRKD